MQPRAIPVKPRRRLMEEQRRKKLLNQVHACPACEEGSRGKQSRGHRRRKSGLRRAIKAATRLAGIVKPAGPRGRFPRSAGGRQAAQVWQGPEHRAAGLSAERREPLGLDGGEGPGPGRVRSLEKRACGRWHSPRQARWSRADGRWPAESHPALLPGPVGMWLLSAPYS